MLNQDNRPEGLDAWIEAGARGASAGSIAAHLGGYGQQTGAYPRDAGDFGRCEVLLDMVPGFRERLDEMAGVNAYWRALVALWSEIQGIPDNMRSAAIAEITRPIESRDPTRSAIGGVRLQLLPVTFKDEQGTAPTLAPGGLLER